MKTDVLTVVTTGYDDSTGFYVNGEKVADIHCNDEHEIPAILYGLMVAHNFANVEEKRLSEEGCKKYGENGDEHPEILSDYSPSDFEE